MTLGDGEAEVDGLGVWPLRFRTVYATSSTSLGELSEGPRSASFPEIKKVCQGCYQSHPSDRSNDDAGNCTPREARTPLCWVSYYVQLDGVTPLGTDCIEDFTLILPRILPLDRVYPEGAVVQGQLHSILELQPLAIEEPMDGDPGVI